MSSLVQVIFFFLSTHFASAAGEGVSLTADQAFLLGDFPVTNSMITSWVIYSSINQNYKG